MSAPTLMTENKRGQRLANRSRWLGLAYTEHSSMTNKTLLGLTLRYAAIISVDLLLRHPLQGFERRPHVSLGQTHQQSVVFHTNLVDGLAAAFLQAPFQLCSEMLKPVLSGIHQLEL